MRLLSLRGTLGRFGIIVWRFPFPESVRVTPLADTSSRMFGFSGMHTRSDFAAVNALYRKHQLSTVVCSIQLGTPRVGVCSGRQYCQPQELESTRATWPPPLAILPDSRGPSRSPSTLPWRYGLVYSMPPQGECPTRESPNLDRGWGEGFEPPIVAPKATALPLGDAPKRSYSSMMDKRSQMRPGGD